MAMEMILRVVERSDDAEMSPIYARFDAAGGLIGRADTARLILPDTQRTVSRFHANVSWSDGRFFIEDMGSTNPAAVNDRPLTVGLKVELRGGDQIRIGAFTIAAEYEDPEFAPTVLLDQAKHVIDEIAQQTQLIDRPGSAPAAGKRPPASADELWRGFEEGAQVPVPLPYGPRPEMMNTVGVLLRACVTGLRRLLQVRAAAKRDVDADITTIRPRHNNPLKFASDDTRALAALLKPPMHSFLSGPAAIQDAIDDLESHSIASSTALRGAMEKTLARFDPEALEQRLSAPGVLDSLVPMHRKAKLWELYLDQHRAIKREAEDSFEDAFTRAFAEAYEKETARLKKARA